MPVYEYECTECGARFELRRSIADSDNEAKCPRCGKERTRRVFSTFGTASSPRACSPRSFT